MSARREAVQSAPGTGLRTMAGAALVFRWAALAWMTLLNATASQPFHRPLLAWLGIAAAGLWTLWLTFSHGLERPGALWIDLALSMGLIVLSGLVVGPREVEEGDRLFYATAYPISTSLAWGAGGGVSRGLFATAALGVALALSRPVNDIPLSEFDVGRIQSLGNGIVNYLLGGLVAGAARKLLDSSAEEVRKATEEALRAKERAARLAERESLARAIHDSVLQALALVHKRGKELAEEETVAGSAIMGLVEMAGEQERALRALILREPEEAPEGTASLRDALERVARAVIGVPVTVSAVGPIWLPAGEVEQLVAAVRQALENVVEHAEASRAAVFADTEDGWVIVSVRDNGRGFEYDAGRLKEEGKAGILKSMKGRIEDLGGRMRLESASGLGTEVEFRVPVEGAAE